MPFFNLHHYGNALHVYCRLRDLGVPKCIAKKIGWIYEKLIHPVIYKFPIWIYNNIKYYINNR